MADMVNQTLTQLLAPSPRRGGNYAPRAQDGGAPSREPFANSLDRSMAHPEKSNDAAKPAANTPPSPASARSSDGKGSTPAKPADAASAPAKGTKTDASDDAAAADVTNESDAATAAESGTDETNAADQTPADATPQPNDLAASLAATPAALAAASANPASVEVIDEAATRARSIDPLATALSNEADPKARGGAGKADVDLDATRSDAGLALDQDTADTAGTAPTKLRATPFAAQLDARLEANGGRIAEPLMPAPAATSPTALGTAAIHIPGADRPQALQAALPMHVSTPASQSGWADAVGNRVLWLVGRDESRAELILTPPSLGKLEISLTVSGDSTTAHFVAATPAAREALEQAMPRLREMFEQAGVTLAESNVNTASQDQPGERGSGDGQRSGHAAANDAPSELTPHVGGPWLQRGEGMIDIFA